MDFEPQDPSDPFGIYSVFEARVFRNEKGERVKKYVAYANKLFLWFETHAHLIKEAAAERDPKYAHVCDLNEVELTMHLVGYECFPAPSVEMKKDVADGYSTPIFLTVDQYNRMLTRLYHMGAFTSKCTNGQCQSCGAYHAFLRVNAPL